MDKITKSEYRMLRACTRKPCKFGEDEALSLLHNNYIRPQFTENINGVVVSTSYYYEITHDGQVAYEHYHDYVFERRMVSFRAWLALGLSAISILLTILNMFFLSA